MWDVLSRVAKMAWDVMSGVTKTAWEMSGVTNLCGMFCLGCQKMAWDVLSRDVLSGSPLHCVHHWSWLPAEAPTQSQFFLILLTLCELDTPKRILWQTLYTQMKCRIMRHFIKVCTVFAKPKWIFRERNTIFFGKL